MPIKEPTGKWRAIFKINGKRHQKIFETKTEAKKWEVEEKAKLKSLAQTPQGMDLEIFFSIYLDFAVTNFSEKVYKKTIHTAYRRHSALAYGGKLRGKSPFDLLSQYRSKKGGNIPVNLNDDMRDDLNLLCQSKVPEEAKRVKIIKSAGFKNLLI